MRNAFIFRNYHTDLAKTITNSISDNGDPCVIPFYMLYVFEKVLLCLALILRLIKNDLTTLNTLSPICHCKNCRKTICGPTLSKAFWRSKLRVDTCFLFVKAVLAKSSKYNKAYIVPCPSLNANWFGWTDIYTIYGQDDETS